MQASSMPPPGPQVSSGACCFFPVMIAFIDSIRHSFIIEYKILVKGSGTYPTSCFFVTFHLPFFFSSLENINRITVVLVIIIYSACQLFVNSVFVTINMVSSNSRVKFIIIYSLFKVALRELSTKS